MRRFPTKMSVDHRDPVRRGSRNLGGEKTTGSDVRALWFGTGSRALKTVRLILIVGLLYLGSLPARGQQFGFSPNQPVWDSRGGSYFAELDPASQGQTVKLTDFPFLNTGYRWDEPSPGDSAGEPKSSEKEPKPSEKEASVENKVGYKNGLFISSEDYEKNESYLLRLNGWGHFRMSHAEAYNGTDGFSQLQLKRARIILQGHAFTPAFSYFVALDGRSQADGAIRLLDYYLDYDLGSAVWGFEAKALHLKLGQYKVPFTLSRFLSAQELQFADRSMSSMFFDANRSLALGIGGQRRLGARLWTWETAIFNGLVTGGAETGAAGNLDNNFAVSGRLSSYFGGEWGDAQCDYDYHPSPVFRLGGAFAVSKIDRKGPTEFNSIRVVDSGQRLSNLLPGEIEGYLVDKYAVDASMKLRGWSITSEYYFRNMGQFVGGELPGLFDHGFSLDTGYFLIPKKLEMIGRWSRVVGSSGTLGDWNQSADEKAIGLVRYFRHHNAKLSVDATYLDGAPIDSFSLDIFPGQKGWLFRTQLQFSF
jgi:hypothetical protein